MATVSASASVRESLADEFRLNQDPPREICEHPPFRGDSHPYFEHVPVELAAMFVTDAGDLGPASVSELGRPVINREESACLAGIIQLASGM